MHGGRSVYFGKVEECQPYFASIGYVCPNFYNPADFYSMMIWRESYECERRELKVWKEWKLCMIKVRKEVEGSKVDTNYI